LEICDERMQRNARGHLTGWNQHSSGIEIAHEDEVVETRGGRQDKVN
jgi:hypothetical protein